MAGPLTISNQQPVSRVNRYPAHLFDIRVRPFQIVPFMIAPVLPGETLQAFHFEAREVSDPLASSLRGIKSEWHLFYVKMLDLADGNLGMFDEGTLQSIFTDPLGNPLDAFLETAAEATTFHNGGVNWTRKCLNKIVTDHFRDRGESYDADSLGGYPLAQVREQGWQDSLTDVTDIPDGAELGDPSATTTPEELQALMDRFQALQDLGWTAVNWEDYLAMNGVHVPKSQLGITERIDSFRQWKYPSNTIDPTDGSAVGAVSWVFKEDSRDAKRFTEPGFLVGVHIVRPKVFFGNRKGSLTHFLNRGLDWLPAVLADNPETSLRTFSNDNASDGPLGTVPTNDYVIDIRDLFVHGDSFVNYTEDASSPRAALPTAALKTKYLSSADVNEFFVDNTGGSNKNLIRADGFCSLTIRGTQRDYTRGAVLSGL